ncbi:sodium-dependent transporter [Lawsonia intracellularis]|uniref:Probable sodium-dependent transporter n=1 Tax=Lawsonia intracellularis (strain PHE/MN1-00) TaxID=363253 RepID=Q1MR94_LAWIP|nr:sodium-dependent transporter [Lawsonia intracellularis]AGC49844.1 sodium-dependent transporter [Lawsonia intracellularis N343]KAA0205348.1 sodium-dependent transporter [Lawsonia intracellularis]MBZ3892118.1 sodium-dependent transporter [Lawsonia intracellularis]RBN32105.1 sodium-dependent transporter [Lawsonia intracellularis]RBN33673.1 sodium-dependent transporter [Lawsonia intracellularis]
MVEKQKRDSFTSKIGILAATLGSAVGLGNIWKFPTVIGQNGGASFLLIYIIATIVAGLPIMIAEIAIGRSTRANAVEGFKKLSSGYWWLVGFAGTLSTVFVLGFYTEVAGWIYAYIFKAANGSINTTQPVVAGYIFQELLSNPWQTLLWQWLVIILVATIVLRGASKGIEKAATILMPILFILLIIICIRSITLPNAIEGLRFLFMPDFSKIDGRVILLAMGLAFFKLSIGMGVMLTYGSYFKDDVNIPYMATKVMLLDLVVSLLSGIAIFPVVFSFGFEPSSGPGLLFITIPAVFDSMPAGQIFTGAFFILAAVASTGAMLSLFETPVAWAIDTFNLSRKNTTIIIMLFFIAFGAPVALSENILKHITIFGMNFFQLYDFLSSNILMPLGGFFLCIFVGYVWNKQMVMHAISNGGTLHNQGLIKLLLFQCRYVTPVIILIIMLHGFNLFAYIFN